MGSSRRGAAALGRQPEAESAEVGSPDGEDRLSDFADENPMHAGKKRSVTEKPPGVAEAPNPKPKKWSIFGRQNATPPRGLLRVESAEVGFTDGLDERFSDLGVVPSFDNPMHAGKERNIAEKSPRAAKAPKPSPKKWSIFGDRPLGASSLAVEDPDPAPMPKKRSFYGRPLGASSLAVEMIDSPSPSPTPSMVGECGTIYEEVDATRLSALDRNNLEHAKHEHDQDHLPETATL
jgi:hypothetical protein